MERFSEADELAKLAALRDAGVLSDKEFQRRKRQTLANGGRPARSGLWLVVAAAAILVVAAVAVSVGLTTRRPPNKVHLSLAASTAEQNAVSWADALAASHSTEFHTLCLSFVVDAWETGAHYDIRKQMPGLNGTSYPATIVKVLAGGTHGDTGTPPAGAIGFWSNSLATPTYSHAALSTGTGTFVSTDVAATQKSVPYYTRIHHQTFAQFGLDHFSHWLGWWLPDGSAAPPAPPPTTSTTSTTGAPALAAPAPSSNPQKTQPATLLQPAAPGSVVQPAAGLPPQSSNGSTGTTSSGYTTNGGYTTTSSPAPGTTPPSTPPTTSTPAPQPTTYAETVGGVAHTWTDYVNAGGTQGPSIAPSQTVQISCRLQGFKVADGNTWWYRIAQSPWSTRFYVSADAFYNNGQTSGSLIGTPFVDPNVRIC